MTELEIPPDATSDQAEELVREFLEVGDEVEVRTDEVTEADDSWASGTVTGFERTEAGVGVLALDGEIRKKRDVAFEEISTISKLEEE